MKCYDCVLTIILLGIIFGLFVCSERSALNVVPSSNSGVPYYYEATTVNISEQMCEYKDGDIDRMSNEIHMFAIHENDREYIRGFDLYLKGFKIGGYYEKPLLCLDYNRSLIERMDVLDASYEAYIPISAREKGYDECWEIYTDLNDEDHYDTSIYFTYRNPNEHIDGDIVFKVMVMDYVPFAKATNGIVYWGYEDSTTLADVGGKNTEIEVRLVD